MYNWGPTNRLDTLLDQCIDQLDEQPPERLLEQYPHSAVKLAPMLEIAVALREMGEIEMAAGAKQKGRARLRYAVLEKQRRRGRRFPPTLLHAATLVALVCIALIVGGSTVTVASAGALPEDRLYGWKRASEQVWLKAQPSPARAVAVSMALSDRRVDELKLFYARHGYIHTGAVADLQRSYAQTVQLVAAIPENDVQPWRERVQAATVTHSDELGALAGRAIGKNQELLRSAVQSSIRAGAAVQGESVPPPPAPTSGTQRPTYEPIMVPAATQAPVLETTPLPTATQAVPRSPEQPTVQPTDVDVAPVVVPTTGTTKAPKKPAATPKPKASEVSKQPNPTRKPSPAEKPKATTVPKPPKKAEATAVPEPPKQQPPKKAEATAMPEPPKQQPPKKTDATVIPEPPKPPKSTDAPAPQPTNAAPTEKPGNGGGNGGGDNGGGGGGNGGGGDNGGGNDGGGGEKGKGKGK